MDNLYFLSHSIKLSSHPFLHSSLILFHFHFPSSENGFHWNLFCDNIFISSFHSLTSHTPFKHCVCCWQWLSMAFFVDDFFVLFVSLWLNKNVTKMMFVFFHCLHTLFMSINRHPSSHCSAYTQNLLTHLFLPIFTMHFAMGEAGSDEPGWGSAWGDILPIYSYTHE